MVKKKKKKMFMVYSIWFKEKKKLEYECRIKFFLITKNKKRGLRSKERRGYKEGK